MATTGFDVLATYVHLPDGPGATPVPVGVDFRETIADRTELHEGRLAGGEGRP